MTTQSVRNLVVAIIASATLMSCGAGPLVQVEGERFSEGGTRGTGTDGVASAAPESGEPLASADGASGRGSSSGAGTVQSGTLTAGIWDDNQNFDWFTSYRNGQQALVGAPPFVEAEQLLASQDSNSAPLPRTNVDISLVIDTTGSMGDEIRYLQAEFTAISAAIAAQYPNAVQRWSLVAYKDDGDSYVVRGANFGTGVTWFNGLLGELSASGGGDMPEAPDQALAKAAQLSWDPSESTAKIVFWVADAPHHEQNAPAFATAVRALAAKGAHVYPVASSGVDELAELSMRAAAQLTRGRYLFLTDDSGVGGAHKEPSIPCYDVTRLDQAIERVVESELSGTRSPPPAGSIIRTVGNPVAGRCLNDKGQSARLF